MSEVDKAKLELRRSKVRAKKYQKKLEAEAEQLTAKIKTLLKQGKKDKARMVLRVRKLREKALEASDRQLLKLEQMLSDIGTSEMNAEMVEAMKEGNKALQAMQSVMSVEYVESVLEEAEDLAATQQEIAGLLSDGGMGVDIDDDEVLGELAQLEGEVGGAEAAATTTVADALDMPEAPTTPVDAPETDVQAEEEGERKLVAA